MRSASAALLTSACSASASPPASVISTVTAAAVSALTSLTSTRAPCLGEEQRGLPPQALPGPGYNRDLARQTIHTLLLLPEAVARW